MKRRTLWTVTLLLLLSGGCVVIKHMDVRVLDNVRVPASMPAR